MEETAGGLTWSCGCDQAEITRLRTWYPERWMVLDHVRGVGVGVEGERERERENRVKPNMRTDSSIPLLVSEELLEVQSVERWRS